MKALIAGGGIGGLTAALCLLEAGIDVEVFERNPAPAEIGAGIQISPNGVKVLERLGLKPQLDTVSFRPEALEMRLGRSGLKLFSIPLCDEALSVSAVWGRAFRVGEKLYGHVIDPRTGQPVQRAVMAALVLPSATERDALSTALLTLGTDGLDFITRLRPGSRALVVAPPESCASGIDLAVS